MDQVKRLRLAKDESSAENSDTTLKPRWDNLPYPVIHIIAKLDLQTVKYAHIAYSLYLYSSM